MPRRQLDAPSLLVFSSHATVLYVTVVAVETRLLKGLRLEAAVDWLAAFFDLGLHLLRVDGAIDALAGGRHLYADPQTTQISSLLRDLMMGTLQSGHVSSSMAHPYNRSVPIFEVASSFLF